jgi:hypothetical protein
MDANKREGADQSEGTGDRVFHAEARRRGGRSEPDVGCGGRTFTKGNGNRNSTEGTKETKEEKSGARILGI